MIACIQTLINYTCAHPHVHIYICIYTYAYTHINEGRW